jgi:arylsulfatase A-like enzyme
MSFRVFRLFTLLVWCVAADVCFAAAPPNVLVILSDDQGLHDVSYYGREDIETPSIDRLAREGLILDQAFANSSVCSPTRASLLTGRYSNYTGVQGVIRDVPVSTWGYWNPSCPSLVRQFQRFGYDTAMIGKWHLGLREENHPLRRGFEFYRGFLGDMMDDYYTHLRRGHNFMRDGYEAIAQKGHATDLFSDWAADYVESRAESDQPFFLYLAYTAPHNPIQPPEEWVARVMERESGISEKRARYVALVEHMDAGIGRVLDSLRETDELGKTLIVFSSDNGGHLVHGAHNGPYRADKGTMYDGGLRVPTLFYWQEKIAARGRSDQLFMSMDILPTILGLIGASPDLSEIEGEDYSAQILGAASRQRSRPMIFSRREGRQVFGGKQSFAVRMDGFKLLQSNPFTPLELYHVAEDPFETTDLLADPTRLRTDLELRDIYTRLHEEMTAFNLQSGRYPYQPPEPPTILSDIASPTAPTQ